jgi:hypothetical protein
MHAGVRKCCCEKVFRQTLHCTSGRAAACGAGLIRNLDGLVVDEPVTS